MKIVAQNLAKRFGWREVLSSINFEINSAESVVLLGPNGAGKTTLLRILAGLLRPTSGAVSCQNGGEVFSVRSVRSQIGFVGHDIMLYGDFTIEQNLRFFGSLYDIPATPRRTSLDEKISQVLDEWGLSFFADYRVNTLSRGLKQRATLARALISDPKILLLDEPFTGLDEANSSHLEEILKKFVQDGKTIVFAAHDEAVAQKLASRAMYLKSGYILTDGSVKEALESARSRRHENV